MNRIIMQELTYLAMEFHTLAAIEISVSFIVEVLTLSFPDYFEVVISGVHCSIGGGHL
jgi:hypothetical protein